MAINSKLEHDAHGFCCMSLVMQAAHHRVSYEALQIYGDHGASISGAVREHFPEAVKQVLRTLAHTSSEYLARSLNCWMKSGHRRATWRRDVLEFESRDARGR